MKINNINNYMDYEIDCLSHNSKEIFSNAVFFCIEGNNTNGYKYISEAIKNGAKVIVSSCSVECGRVCNIVVDNVRRSMSVMAKQFYHKSDEKLQKIAIVGTNGKTTTSHIIANILYNSGKKVGVIGTNGVYIMGERLPSSMTTPDPIELHYIFLQMVSFGVEIVVMEVSAHAIYYDKIYGINFDIGVFTNITNEHLDFFCDMDNYFKVKKSIFNKKYMKEVSINIDDEYGVNIIKNIDIPAVSYGIYNPCNIFACKAKMSISGSRFLVNANDDILNINTSLVGEYNIYNILASISVAKLLGISNSVVEKSINNIPQIDGRFMRYDLSENKKIIIDFAHTPDGFYKVLSLIKKLRKGSITVVFGCVGYSDKNKRSMMGIIASTYANKIVVTTDNIGKSNFEEIYNDIVMDINENCLVECIADRQNAIKFAYENMVKNETLVILGKGTEDKQVIGNKNISYCDVDVVLSLIGEGDVTSS